MVHFPDWENKTAVDANVASIAGGKVVLWNTASHNVTQGPAYPSINSDPLSGGQKRTMAESMVWNNSTIIFGGGNNLDSNIYKFTIDNGFQDFTTFDEAGRHHFNMINVPSSEFICNKK